MRKKILISSFLIIVCLSVFAVAGITHAQGGVTLAPATQEVVLKEDTAEVSFELLLTNRDSSEVTLRLKGVDFKALDESGGVAFVGLKAGETETKYGLTSWLRFPSDVVTISAGGTEKIKVTIDNRDDLAPGGHYGAVIAAPIDPENPEDTPEVDILPATAALILLKKLGGEQFSLVLDRTDISNDLWRLPKKIGLRFQNTGNVHAVPRGTVVIKGPAGQVVSKAVINETSATVLPETFRMIHNDFRPLDRAFWPGKYSVVVEWRYDGSETINTRITTLWYVGQGGYVVASILIFVLIVLWITSRRRRKKSRTKER